MKHSLILIITLSLIFSGFTVYNPEIYHSTPTEDTIWDYKKLNTAIESIYLNDFEKEIILEMNKARINPSAYAEMYILPLIDYYDNKLLKIPGEIPIRTKEGARAARECYRFMKKAKAVGILYPSYGLSRGALELVKYQKGNGKTGHSGKYGSTVVDRIEQFGSWDIAAGENIAYGLSDAQLTIVSLLIDDGVKDRGHRHSMFDRRFTKTGVGSGPHKKYKHMCVITYAGAYLEGKTE
ncbi:MAG: hypothetical protein JEZ03_11815 [Bacteroidales bacterium]|nr:hypothetical protein [Bacteroidales bacterium]